MDSSNLEDLDSSKLKEIKMKRKLFYMLAVPAMFSLLAVHGSCVSQCEDVRQEIIKDCRNDLGPNNERCREDQQKAQQICHDDSLAL